MAQQPGGIWRAVHKGSVPTLWHVLHPDARPAVWLRTEDGYDQRRVGLEFTELESLPDGCRKWIKDSKQRNAHFA